MPRMRCEQQAELDSDITDYSGEAQEHQGKCMKKWITLTNQQLYSDENGAKNGEKKVGFLQQAATRAVVQRHIDTTAPQRASKRQREVEKEGREPKKLVKQEAKGH